MARSALASISFAQGNVISIGGHPLICQYLRGIFNAPTSLKQSLSTWNPITLLQYFRTWSPANWISLKQLSYKLMTLMLLITDQRGQTLIACRVDHGSHGFTCKPSCSVVINNSENINTKLSLGSARKKTFPGDRRICPFTYLTPLHTIKLSVKYLSQII